MATLDLHAVSKSYGTTQILRAIDLNVVDGEFCVFVGPSGCGKSTLLRLICGLDEVSGGEICIEGQVVNDVPAAKRGLAMVFQSYALYPHMNVAANMGYALRLAGLPKAEIETRVKAAAAILRIDHLLERRPRELSGGQRQRVAIGRSIVREPRIFLFDEPLSNLDAALRAEMRFELARLKDRLGTTTIYVTHDQTEAMTLADKIVVMNEGRIAQVGAPMALYQHPANQFVAGFIGSPKMNFLPAIVESHSGDGATVRLAGGHITALRARAPQSQTITIGLRPEHIAITDHDAAIKGRVIMVERLGSDTFVYVSVDGLEPPLLVRVDGDLHIAQGDVIGLTFAPADAHPFDADGSSLRPTLSPEKAAA